MGILTPETGLNITVGMDYLYPQTIGGSPLIQDVESSEEINEIFSNNNVYNESIFSNSVYPNLGIGKSFNKKFKIVHSVLNKDKKDWVSQYYKINRLTRFNIIWAADSRTYRVMFLNPPKFSMIGGRWWKAELNLIQT